MRQLGFLLIQINLNFNPRTHVGCDEVYEALLGWLREFQSTHPRGVRPQVITSSRRYLGFQSTHPRGVRLWSSSPAPSISNFNPRTHVGCDISLSFFVYANIQFQSTHPRGVRLKIEPEAAAILVFQSTHPRGVRRCCQSSTRLTGNFNPRTHVGCDMLRISVPTLVLNFNPRTHVGCDFSS